jgi:hypothetical protein
MVSLDMWVERHGLHPSGRASLGRNSQRRCLQFVTNLIQSNTSFLVRISMHLYLFVQMKIFNYHMIEEYQELERIQGSHRLRIFLASSNEPDSPSDADY